MKHSHALPAMMTRYSIDFVVQMLNASIFHVSFPALLIPLVKWYGYPNDSPLFQAAAAYGILLYLVKILLSFHDRKQRTSGKVDWEDEVVLITGGTITSCHTRRKKQRLRRQFGSKQLNLFYSITGASGVGYLLAEMLAIRHITVVVLDILPVKTACKTLVCFRDSNLPLYHQ